MVETTVGSTPIFVEHGSGARLTLRDLTSDLRLEASAYSIEVRTVQDTLRASGHKLKPLFGRGGYAKESYKASLFRRNLVKAEFGVPFMGSSDIIFIDFRPRKFLSKKNTLRLDTLMLREWDVLISRSGTVGNVAIAPPSWTQYAASEHILRVRFESPVQAGYATCFLRSRWGRVQTVGSSYGSVISHIEPQHLERVLIPMLDDQVVQAIGEAFCSAALKREESSRLMREAEGAFADTLNLPPVPRASHDLVSKVQLNELGGRFDANYHAPISRSALESIRAQEVPCLTVKELAGAGSVRAVTKFRKRTFAKQGLPFVSSKEVFQIDPINLDRLSKNAHLTDMPEIELRRGMIAVTCSGTLGRVIQIPAYMNGWSGSQDFLRIVCESIGLSSYLTAWLGSSYGQAILKRFAYGSVIRHIDKTMLESMIVPVLDDSDVKRIGTLALRATELREEAWQLEQSALRELESHLTSLGT